MTVVAAVDVVATVTTLVESLETVANLVAVDVTISCENWENTILRECTSYQLWSLA